MAFNILQAGKMPVNKLVQATLPLWAL